MVAALSNSELLSVALAVDAINQPVLARNAARPPARKSMFKGLRFPKPLKWIALDVLDQIVDGVEDLFVLSLTLKILLPGIFSPSSDHAAVEPAFAGSIKSRSINLP